jgi:hypothetical protein
MECPDCSHTMVKSFHSPKEDWNLYMSWVCPNCNYHFPGYEPRIISKDDIWA